MIYHIIERSAWQQAQKAGEYRPESLEKEGFIHFSRIEQVLGVANAFYRELNDLLLLQVEPEKLQATIKNEPPVHPQAGGPQTSDLFPHLYGPLNLDAVVQVFPLATGPDGLFQLPAGV